MQDIDNASWQLHLGLGASQPRAASEGASNLSLLQRCRDGSPTWTVGQKIAGSLSPARKSGPYLRPDQGSGDPFGWGRTDRARRQQISWRSDHLRGPATL